MLVILFLSPCAGLTSPGKLSETGPPRMSLQNYSDLCWNSGLNFWLRFMKPVISAYSHWLHPSSNASYACLDYSTASRRTNRLYWSSTWLVWHVAFYHWIVPRLCAGPALNTFAYFRPRVARFDSYYLIVAHLFSIAFWCLENGLSGHLLLRESHCLANLGCQEFHWDCFSEASALWRTSLTTYRTIEAGWLGYRVA